MTSAGVRTGALLLTVLLLAGCSSVATRAGPTWDAGTVGVSGAESGVGGHTEVVGYRGPASTGFGLGPALGLAGYSSSGDADPIAFTTIEGRWRGEFGREDGRGAMWELGSGIGGAWTPTLSRAVVPLHAGVGWQLRAGGAHLSVELRERVLAMVGSGSPPTDVLSSLQLVLGLGLGSSR